MTSSINPAEPKEGLTYTVDTRTNFQHAKDEIEALQAKDISQDTAINGKEPANSNIQAHVTATSGNPHNVTKTDVGLVNVDNTSDLNKPISTATQAALDNKKDDFSENTGFNKPFGTTTGTVSEGNHSHTAADVGAAPSTHVGDSSHLTSDERAAMTQAAPSGADPIITQSDLDAHVANQVIHITPNENDALDGANNPSASNVFATIADVGVGSGHTIQDPAGTPVPDQPNMQFTGDVTVTDDSGNNRTVVNVTAGAGSGEANTASNIGTGIDLYSGKVGVDLQFRRVNETGNGMTITQNTQDITFNLNYGGSGSENGVLDTLARSDHNHNSAYLGISATAANSSLLNNNPDTHFATATGLSDHESSGMHIPAGGAQFSFLGKFSSDDYDVVWATPGYEPELGNPTSDGDILSSTIAGVRSWVSPGTPDLTDATFPTYAVFQNVFAASAAIDFANGNKQALDVTGLSLTFAAPGPGSFILDMVNSDALTAITTPVLWDSGTVPTWAGRSVLALFYDGTNWFGSALVGAT